MHIKTDFETLIESNLKRRSFIKNSVKLGLASFVLGGTTSLASSATTDLLGFEQIPANSLDTVTLPEGYSWDVVIRWGDPLFSGVENFDQNTRGTAASQELSFGDNNDGMNFFLLEKDHGLIVVNNEYANLEHIIPKKVKTKDDILKTQAAVGLSHFEVKRISGRWILQKDGMLNRRITAQTPMALSGPAKYNDHLKTAEDKQGVSVKGTWANCGQGKTPWGTYLTCEENFNGFFASSNDDVQLTKDQTRYGVKRSDWNYEWYKIDDRFDLSKEPNEPNRFGYVVEIDPLNPTDVPQKRTALGRFKHENAEVVIADNNQVVVYMGDDERGEFLYKFISKNKYVEGDREHNKKLLDDGTLYVARFDITNSEGYGEWVELTFGKNGLDESSGFNNQGDVLIFARRAGSVVGATTMDRPEWVAADPLSNDVYCALTNNKNRGKRSNAGGDSTPVGGPNPREANLYGQILRWSPMNGDHTNHKFTWDLFAMAGNPEVHQGLKAGSQNINKHNMFNSPDGLAFDSSGRLWIQTDGKYSNEGDFAGMGNNQMLCADTNTGEIKRFMVGPVACEVTGLSWSPDQTTMFVGIQHPGEKGRKSNFPDGEGKVPRSCIIAITKDDGGIIGS